MGQSKIEPGIEAKKTCELICHDFWTHSLVTHTSFAMRESHVFTDNDLVSEIRKRTVGCEEQA